jgi:RNase H-like domain found in reverse transcriptase/Reverse transcriptase (RNA-dependent DNA polymerase)
MCLLNPSDRYRVVNKGADLGRAYPADIIEDTETVSVEQVTENLPRATLPNVAPKNVNPEGEATMPPHLQQVFAESCKQLNEDQSLRLVQLLIEFQDVFAADEFDLGNFTAIEHQIDTGNARPVKQRIRRTPVCFAGEEEAHLQKMLKAGVIQESTSDWVSAPVLIRKRDGSVRWCIDYRALNEVTVKDLFPLPLVDDCLDTLAGSVWFSKLDANSAYWQIRIKEEDRKKTAFITKYGLFEHVRMGFGLTGAPATYARTMNLVLRGLTWKTVLAFLDDILIMGTSFDDHLVNLREALLRFREYGLKLKPKKCTFFQREVEFLGRKVSGNSISMSDIDIKVVQDWPVPTCAKEVERFMGLVNYHRGFIKDFSEIAVPLYAITGKQPFVWGEEQTKAFETLKKALSNPPVLALPNQKDMFILDTDASDLAIGAELLQVQDGEEKVIAYGSYSLTKEQRRYCVTRKELLAVVRFTRQYRHYLLGRPFIVRTDHSSLRWLMRFHEPQGQLARWLEELSQFNMVLKHRAGRKHGIADALS